MREGPTVAPCSEVVPMSTPSVAALLAADITMRPPPEEIPLPCGCLPGALIAELEHQVPDVGGGRARRRAAVRTRPAPAPAPGSFS